MRQVFHPLPWIYPPDLASLKAVYHKHGHLSNYKKGSIVKNGGEAQKHFHLVEGLCAYFINYAEGRPRSFALILPGSSMGDMTCITRERVNVTTIALKDSKILSIPSHVLLDEMKKDALLAIEMCRRAIAKQESSLEATIANFTYEPAERLKIFLKALIITYNKKISEWNRVPLIFTNEEFGMMIDTTRVTVNRILSQWVKEGVIRKEGKQIIAHSTLFEEIYDWLEN